MIVAAACSLVCRSCQAVLVLKVEPLSAEESLASKAGSSRVERGRFAVDEHTYLGHWIVNSEDVVGVERTTDPTRLVGCCGPDGNWGPNLLCECGQEVGTETAACWQVHAVYLDPSAVESVDVEELSTGRRRRARTRKADAPVSALGVESSVGFEQVGIDEWKPTTLETTELPASRIELEAKPLKAPLPQGEETAENEEPRQPERHAPVEVDEVDAAIAAAVPVVERVEKLIVRADEVVEDAVESVLDHGVEEAREALERARAAISTPIEAEELAGTVPAAPESDWVVALKPEEPETATVSPYEYEATVGAPERRKKDRRDRKRRKRKEARVDRENQKRALIAVGIAVVVPLVVILIQVNPVLLVPLGILVLRGYQKLSK